MSEAEKTTETEVTSSPAEEAAPVEEKTAETAVKPKKKKGKIILCVILIVLALIVVGIGIAIASVMLTKRPAAKTAEEYAAGYQGAVITVTDNGSVEIKPGTGVEDRKTGIIFYVGAEIEPEAYIPLLAPLSEQGYSCFIPKMPGNVATFKAGEAGKIIDANTGIGTWYLAGHSLGGFTAAGYAKDHTDKIKGLIFIAAYAGTDISGTDLKLLSIYGDTDTVLNKERYNAALSWNPASFEEHIIAGGNHAQFGDYGEQPGDTAATISAEDQRAQAVAFILTWLAA
ncbi:MAG: alpha/beta hydrolase [Lachnospiraceae bacterium]|nr:alpha/beta hydrolase [Lachnospiraceae bacterium]